MKVLISVLIACFCFWVYSVGVNIRHHVLANNFGNKKELSLISLNNLGAYKNGSNALFACYTKSNTVQFCYRTPNMSLNVLELPANNITFKHQTEAPTVKFVFEYPISNKNLVSNNFVAIISLPLDKKFIKFVE